MSNEEIVRLIQNGVSVTDNMQILYETNLPLIKQFIKPYLYLEEKQDLMQEAYIGLWQAVQHYESSENVRFMTFAQFWIQQAVRRYIENCTSLIRLPSHLREQIGRYKKNVRQLQQELGHYPTDAEIAEYMRISLDRVRKLQLCMYDVASLDAPLYPDSSDNENFTLADTLQDDSSPEESTIDKIYAEYQKSELWGILERFTDTEQRDLLKRYAAGQSIAQIARETGESYQSVRRRFDNILRKLKIGKPGRELRERLETIGSRLYSNSLKRFKERGYSAIEDIAIELMEMDRE